MQSTTNHLSNQTIIYPMILCYSMSSHQYLNDTSLIQGVQENKCGETTWKAARNKNCKYAKLDETGLDIAGCRHSVAQYAVNMYQGELYGYAHYILAKKFSEKPLNFFWQDIMCKFWKWAQKSDPAFNDYQIKPALSVMHAKVPQIQFIQKFNIL